MMKIFIQIFLNIIDFLFVVFNSMHLCNGWLFIFWVCLAKSHSSWSPPVVYTEWALVRVSGRERIIWPDQQFERSPLPSTPQSWSLCSSPTIDKQFHPLNFTHKVWGSLPALSKGSACRNHLPRLITRRSHFFDKFSMVNLNPGLLVISWMF